MSKNPLDQLSVKEIFTMLNSNQYISESKRKFLQDKLDRYRQANKISGLDEFLIMAGHNNITKQNDKSNESYPSLDHQLLREKKQSRENGNNMHVNPDSDASSNIINFGSIITISKYDSEIKIDYRRPLFIDNMLILYFDDIQLMYNSYALKRINLYYYILKNRINILNNVEKINFYQASKLKESFKFTETVDNFNHLTNSISLYKILDQLKILLKKIDMDRQIFFEIEKCLTKCHELLHNCPDLNNKYYTLINEIVINNSNNLFKHNNITTTQDKITFTQNKIILDNDPHSLIDCDYIVELINSDNSNIIPIGISHSIFLPYNHSFDIEDKKKTDCISTWEQYGSPISEREIIDFFNIREKNTNKHFVKIRLNNYRQHDINIYYSTKEKIPKSGFEIKIHNLPKNIQILASGLYNHNDDPRKTFGPVPVIKMINNTKKKYDKLSRQNKKYTIQTLETSSNHLFSADHLFNELLNQDNNNIIKPSMYKSYQKLVVDNSKLFETI